MPTIERFEDIRAWQTARALTRQIYAVSARGAFARDFGLRDQMRRAAVSILSNIAEGFESGTRPQFVRYLALAKGSAGERRDLALPTTLETASTVECLHIVRLPQGERQ